MNEPIYERMQQLIRQIRQADTAYYKHCLLYTSTAFPPKVYWPRLGQVLENEGLTANVQDHEIAVSW